MNTLNTSPVLHDPWTSWADVGAKTNEILASSASVIGLRTQRMAAAGLQPTPLDLAEMQRMGNEKLEAATESGAAMIGHWYGTQFAWWGRAMQHWFGSANALSHWLASASPAQLLSRGQRLLEFTTHDTDSFAHLSRSTAELAQHALRPIHSRVTANALRLAAV